LFADQVAVPLTEEEVAEKDALSGEGFLSWKRLHFLAFIKGLERYGRDALDKVAAEIPDHDEDNVREYAKVFFARYKDLKGVFLLKSSWQRLIMSRRR
jgi:SWI/SNF-related matrix-associated actin-dependent regulator of chromatin subfamily A member 5